MILEFRLSHLAHVRKRIRTVQQKVQIYADKAIIDIDDLVVADVEGNVDCNLKQFFSQVEKRMQPEMDEAVKARSVIIIQYNLDLHYEFERVNLIPRTVTE